MHIPLIFGQGEKDLFCVIFNTEHGRERRSVTGKETSRGPGFWPHLRSVDPCSWRQHKKCVHYMMNFTVAVSYWAFWFKSKSLLFKRSSETVPIFVCGEFSPQLVFVLSQPLRIIFLNGWLVAFRSRPFLFGGIRSLQSYFAVEARSLWFHKQGLCFPVGSDSTAGRRKMKEAIHIHHTTPQVTFVKMSLWQRHSTLSKGGQMAKVSNPV